jgi:NADPH-dependent 2,4-dienoyl-CoA reductase/sulfur reductase-like enzyme
MANRYLIIGNGAAGQSAAEAIRPLDASGEITLLTQEPHDFYSRPGLAYYLTGALPEELLFSRRGVSSADLGLHVLTGKARRVDAVAHTVELADGRLLPYDRLLLATGASAALPPIPGIDLAGVVTLDTLDDARKILLHARRARQAVVVGGGITALELAEGLAAQGVETHYLLRRDRYWGNVLDPEESALVEQHLEEERIHLRRWSELRQVLGRRGRVQAVETHQGHRIACQMVAVAIGIRPRLELARSAGVEHDRGILVDARLRTSVADIYSAGDAAQILDPATGQHRLDSLWWMAIESGSAAGQNMAGACVDYVRGIPFNVTSLAGLTTTILGRVGQALDDTDLVAIARGDSETWREQADGLVAESAATDSRVRLVVGPKHILGAVIMGEQALSRPLEALIREKVDATPILHRLAEKPQNAPALVMDLWNRWSGGKRGARA